MTARAGALARAEHRRRGPLARLRGRSGGSVDSLLLAVVRIVTLSSTLANTMILSHTLSLSDYGTYAQGVLVVALCSDIVVLGQLDAVNYFFNKNGQGRIARRYVNTCFLIQATVGAAAALILVVGSGRIGAYFGNPGLSGLVGYLALRPMLTNMTGMFQVLIVAIGRARAIAARNLVFTALKFLAVLVTALVTSDIALLFAMLLALDVASVVWFWNCFRRWGHLVRPTWPRWFRLRQILSFCLPMGVYVGTSSLMRQTGALVIGMNEPTGRYAIYANTSTVLPLDVISLSFLTVIIPVLTRYISAGERRRALTLLRHYLSVGYHTTVTLAVACFAAAPELIRVLFGADYLPGYTVFSLHLALAAVRFAGMSLVLSAAGRTRTLMAVSLAALAANAALSAGLYAAIGFVGPALASVTVNVAMTAVLLHLSLRELSGTWRQAFDPTGLGRYLLVAVLALAAGLLARLVLDRIGAPVVLTAVVVVAAVAGLIVVLTRSQLAASLRAINAMA